MDNFIPKPKVEIKNRYQKDLKPCIECKYKYNTDRLVGPINRSYCANCGDAICNLHGAGLRSIPYVCSRCKDQQKQFVNLQTNPTQTNQILANIEKCDKMFKCGNSQTDKLVEQVFKDLII